MCSRSPVTHCHHPPLSPTFVTHLFCHPPLSPTFVTHLFCHPPLSPTFVTHLFCHPPSSPTIVSFVVAGPPTYSLMFNVFKGVLSTLLSPPCVFPTSFRPGWVLPHT